jgi:Fe-S cluster biogenesis protein NfuA
LREQAERVVDQVLRPLIEADGGTVHLRSVTEDAVTVELGAACAGCPGLHYTRTHVIEPLLRSKLGPAIRVEVERAPEPPPRSGAR